MSITITELNAVLEKATTTIDILSEDVQFLSHRLSSINSKWQLERDTGESSDSLVGIAYGTATIEEQKLPSDEYDYAACIRAFEKLPQHRKELQVVKTAMDNINNHYLKNIRQ